MGRKYKQVPLTIYPDVEILLKEAIEKTKNLQASVLREALTIGLEVIINRRSPTQAATAPQEQAIACVTIEDIKQAMRKVLEEHYK